MALLTSRIIPEFKIGMEHFTVTETGLSSRIFLLTIVSTRERWHWKEDLRTLESEILQFSGTSSSDVRKQCDEWFFIHFKKTMQAIVETA